VIFQDQDQDQKVPDQDPGFKGSANMLQRI